MTKINIKRIWWRNVQLGEFYNIERFHRIPGGGGSLYIEIPGSIVSSTLDFLGATERDLPLTIQASVIGNPSVSGEIEFQKKAGGRMRIANQNRQQPSSQRHPAWIESRGFPKAPDGIANKEDAMPYFPEGGLRIYIAQSTDGNYFAGFTKGVRPSDMPENHPMWELYNSGVGGLIEA